MQEQITNAQQEPQPAELEVVPAAHELSLEQAATVAGGPMEQSVGK